MEHSYITEDIESFYLLIGILAYQGFELDYDYMRDYLESHPDAFLILVKE